MSSMLYKDIFNFLEWSFPNPNFILGAFQIISCSLYLELYYHAIFNSFYQRRENFVF